MRSHTRAQPPPFGSRIPDVREATDKASGTREREETTRTAVVREELNGKKKRRKKGSGIGWQCGGQRGWKGDKTESTEKWETATEVPCARSAGGRGGNPVGRSLDSARLPSPLESHVLACQTRERLSEIARFVSRGNENERTRMMTKRTRILRREQPAAGDDSHRDESSKADAHDRELQD